MSHIGVCYNRGLSQVAFRLAVQLRRAGITCDYSSGGKPQKQFDRLKRDGATVIIQVQTEDQCVMWWASDGQRRRGTIDQALEYHLWFEDETDTLPQPDGPFIRLQP